MPADDFTVTPYTVTGDIDYDRLLNQFGADALTSEQRSRFPRKVRTRAYSGGQTSTEQHRRQGGDPEIDVPYQLLYYFFEDNDERLDRLAREYRTGSLLSTELKDIAAAKVVDFLEAHQRQREQLGLLEEELVQYRLQPTERAEARCRAGYATDALVQQH